MKLQLNIFNKTSLKKSQIHKYYSDLESQKF